MTNVMHDATAPGEGSTRISLSGAVTIYEAAGLKAQLMQAIAGGAVEIDLSAADEVDTAGVQLLLLARRDALRRGQAFRVSALAGAWQEALELYGLAPLFAPAQSSPEDAP